STLDGDFATSLMEGAFNCLHLGWGFCCLSHGGGLLTASTLDRDFAASLMEGGGTRSVTEGVLYEVSTCRWYVVLAR
ncbi:hypothetical protein SAMN02745190_01727, partial [Schwartzia succinivorans DSM 10502]